MYYVWREDNYNQTWSRIVGQKISLEGEMVWAVEGVEVGAYLPRRADYSSVQIDNNGNPCFFYMENTSNTIEYAAYAQIRSPAGDSLWNTTFMSVSEQGSKIHSRSDLLVLPCMKNQWVALWQDNRPEASSMSNQDYVWGQNILSNGNLGYNPDAVSIETKEPRSGASFSITSNPASGSTSFIVKNMQGKKAEIYISGVSGQKITSLFNGVIGSSEEKIVWNIPALLPKGIYFATLRSGQYSKTIKVIKK
jgi:hypothetical protein